MRNPEKILTGLSDHSQNGSYRFERLYRILFNRGMYAVAYQKIYANEGNMTKDSDGLTIDGLSLKRIDSLIEALKDESYQPLPSRRVYIPKKDGRKRPLGISAFNDKLVQEVIRMILENIYEGSFEDASHGFRSGRSCHTALLQTQKRFTGVKWFIEGDIKGFFDNINHVAAIRKVEKDRNTVPYGIAIDADYQRMQYIRYADDFLVGIIGSKQDCEKIKEDVRLFLANAFNLELSDEKTLITNAQKPAHFLGFNIYIRKSNLSKRDCMDRLKRDYVGRVVLEVSNLTIKKKLLDYKAMKLISHNGKEIWKPKARYSLKDGDDLEILDKYNSEIRGFYNYYSIANNSAILHHFKYIMEYSMYKTSCTKYRTFIPKLLRKYRIGKDFCVKFKTRDDREKMRVFYNEGFKRKLITGTVGCDNLPDDRRYLASTSLMDRLQADKCEICGADDTVMEMHHIHKLKDLKGKSYWESLTISRQRKTLAVCRDCHRKIHYGKLD